MKTIVTDWVILFLLAAAISAHAEDGSRTVLKIAESMPKGGGYLAKPGDNDLGLPRDVFLNGEKLFSKGEATYCSGFTFAVAMEAANERMLLTGKPKAQVRTFRREWYGATDDSREKQSVLALEHLGIGHEVSQDEAKPGDFMQFFRKSEGYDGHSAVFQGWIKKGGKIVGVSYISSQSSTGGVGSHSEMIKGANGNGGSIERSRIYFGRLN